eukprot:scpid7593/ scgid6947/ 
MNATKRPAPWQMPVLPPAQCLVCHPLQQYHRHHKQWQQQWWDQQHKQQQQQLPQYYQEMQWLHLAATLPANNYRAHVPYLHDLHFLYQLVRLALLMVLALATCNQDMSTVMYIYVYI